MRRAAPLLFAAVLCSLAALRAEAQETGAQVLYSKGFSIQHRQGYTLLEVRDPWPGAKAGFQYVLYPRGEPQPRDVKADGFFAVPLRRIVSYSTTYLPSILALGEADSLVGVDNTDYVYAPELRQRIASGRIVQTTRNFMPNLELLMSLDPDAIFTFGTGTAWDTQPKMAEAGLKPVVCGEWNEVDPLARAEWIKFFAAFFGKEKEASAIFDQIASNYMAIKALAAQAKERPSVVVDGPYQGSWAVPGGTSYVARLLADAGSAYIWADTAGTGSLTLSVEAVYAKARNADFWLNPAVSARSLADAIALDSRFSSLPALRQGHVWVANLRVSPQGGDDFYESAVLYPDLVLGDLVKIFHPQLLRDRPFSYYRQLVK